MKKLAIIFLTALAAMAFAEPPTVTELYVEGLKAARLHGDRDAAARLFDRAIAADPAHSPSMFAAADNIASVDPARALEYSRAAGRLDTANVWYRIQLAGLLTVNRRYAEAIAEYRTLARTSRNPEAYHRLAALHEATGDPYGALSALDSAEMRFGRTEQTADLRRDLYMKLGLYDRAAEDALLLAREHPDRYESYLVLGRIHMAAGRDSLAGANLERARELNPEGVDVLLSLADYYRNRGDDAGFFAAAGGLFRSRAIDVGMKVQLYGDITRDRAFYGKNYIRASELARGLMLDNPTDYRAVELYAGALFAGGRTEEGVNVYKNYLTDTTSLVEPYTMILDGEAYLGRVDSVDRYAALAIERFPHDVELYLRKGSALSYMGRHGEALKTYRTALKRTADDSVRSVIHTLTGDAYHERGRIRQSFAEYAEAIALYPDNVVALNNYAYFLSVSGSDLDRALRMAERVMELEPDNPTYVDTYGWVLFRMGRLDEAKKALRQAVSLDGSAEVLLHYGDVLSALGEDFMAKYYWEKAAAAGAEVGDRLGK